MSYGMNEMDHIKTIAVDEIKIKDLSGMMVVQEKEQVIGYRVKSASKNFGWIFARCSSSSMGM